LANNSEQPVSCYDCEIPFRQNIDIKDINPKMGCEIELDVEHCNYSMLSANEVEIRAIVNVCIKVVDTVEVPLVSRVSESPIEEKRSESPSITIYFSQPDDNLWKIAKKYYTTVDNIKKINNLSDDDNIQPGQQIIIPRKLNIS